MVILASQALSVEPTIDKASCPGIRTLNFSHEALENWRVPTRFSDGLFGHSVSLYNSTTVNTTSPGWFDYYTMPSDPIEDLARMVATQQRVVYSPDASQRACGSEWDCRYNISFIGPGYQCKSVDIQPSTDNSTAKTAIPPFDEGILIPRGNYSYYAYASGGEYSGVQMENVLPGGMPLEGPPFPQNLGVFRTEPVIWVGHSTIIGSGPVPTNRTSPGWNDYFTAHMFRCDMFETRYIVEFNHYQGSQSTRIVARDRMNLLLNTTYAPGVDANDGTQDKITAFPQDRYVYPNRDKELYRYVAAFHSLGLVFRKLINGTIDSSDVHFPIQDTAAIRSRVIDRLHLYFTVPDVMETMESTFEDVILSMFSYPQFLAVSFAGDPSRIAGYQGGDETTMHPCIRTKLENRFQYDVLELGAVYGVSVILAVAAVAVGTVSVVQNGGALKNTRFSSIATLLQHCGYSLDDYRQPASRGNEPGGN